MIEWVSVPAGPFLMGSDAAAAYPPDEDETPRRVVSLAPYRIARTPVTNREYARFRAGGAEDDVPVTYVTWDDAAEFCAWAGWRLPNEDEWEHAARGGDDRLWPWGDEPPDATRAVFAAGIGTPEAVGSKPAGASPFGVLDLAGNVAEWTEGAFVRGGSYVDGADAIRCSARRPVFGAARDPYIGFRPAASPGEGSTDIDWVDIPGGDVPVGRDPVAYRGEALADELPQHSVELAAFEISTTPVTNEQYAAFVADGGTAPPHWPVSDELAQHPVTVVDWDDAAAFCRWGADVSPARRSGRRRRAAPTAVSIHGATSRTSAVPSSAVG